MDTETAFLPPAPPAPKRHRVRSGLIALGIGLVFAAAIGSQMDQVDTTTAPPSSGVVGTAEPDWAEATRLLEEVGNELAFITPTSAVSADLTHLEAAASLLDEGAALFDGTSYPNQATYLRSAANHTRMAAAAEAGGDFTGMNREMNLAADDLERAVVELP